ncbi:MAG: cytochrome c oxidase subunit [Actinomycetota bacterium]|nr:cytochrome c oxidase subunit [Actinomycetota bacterium]
MRSHHVRNVVIIWAAITAIGVALSFLIPGVMPQAAASGEHDARLTMLVFTIISAPVVALVIAIPLYSLVAWRRAGSGAAPEGDGPPIRSSTPVQVAWISISSALVLFLMVWGLGELQGASANAGPDAMTVNVTGQQWVWSFQYPSSNVESNKLELPVNQQVVFNVTSEDVIHGFWIPNFGLKIDANPGEITQAVVTPAKTGSFLIRCSELCGLYHSYMDSTVKVVSQAEFQSWIASGGGDTGSSGNTTGS